MSEKKFGHVCSHCGRDSSFSILYHTSASIDDDERQYAMLMCDSCNQIMLFIFEIKRKPVRKKNKVHFDWPSSPVAVAIDRSQMTPNRRFLMEISGFEPIDFYPKRPYKMHEAVPKNIATDYAEALTCYDSNCFKAAVAMCRRTMQGICKDKGADRKLDLYKQIDAVVPIELQSYSHEIRLWGNVGVHPDDDITEVKPDEAKMMLDFIKLVFERLYVYPYMLEQSKKKTGK